VCLSARNEWRSNVPLGGDRPVPYTLSALKPEYDQLFSACKVKSGFVAAVQNEATTIIKNKNRYSAVSNVTDVPWFIIGIIHGLESSYRFTQHLHNGDPLTARTVQTPKGHPPKWNPPNTWEASAQDALLYKGFHQWNDWTVAGCLFKFESYNGFGYRSSKVNIKSPYLWSFSDYYKIGKYRSDGNFDPTLISAQCGTAVLLKALSELGAIAIPKAITLSKEDALVLIKKLGKTVRFSNTNYSASAVNLQNALNIYLSLNLEVDGYPGKDTSDAYKRVTGSWLSIDPRN